MGDICYNGLVATTDHSAPVHVPAASAWDVLGRHARPEGHVLSACASERQEADVRGVTWAESTEVKERSITVDPERMRAVCTVPGLLGAERDEAEMGEVDGADGGATLERCTDVLPHELAERLQVSCAVMLDELVHAVNHQGGPQS